MKLQPVDGVIAFYNVALVAVWMPLVSVEPAARYLIAVHLLALAIVPLIASARPSSSPLTTVARLVYPLAWLCAFWREVGIHTQLVGSMPNDAFVLALDIRLLGTNLAAMWMPAMHALPFRELMEGVYFSYYVMLVAIPVAVYLRGGADVRRHVTLALTVAFLGCFLPYAFAPTAGPMFMFPRFIPEGALGLFRTMNDALEAAGDAAGTAFPSSHVAGAIALTWLAWRYLPRPVAWLATLLTIGIVPATVYTQNHFVLDAIGGAVIGVAAQWLIVPALERVQITVSLTMPRLPKIEAEAA